MLHSLGYFILF